jgi:hypothetical protein
MSDTQTTTVTPERQIAASQVGAVFNSLHEYLRTLEPKDPENRSTMTHQLQCAHERVDEAAMWAIKSVLTYGLPPKPTPPAANDAPAAPAAETPAPIGVVDAAAPVDEVPAPAADQQPTADANAPTGADALPPTTPTESV